MAWTQTQVDALEQAIADRQGTDRVQFGDESVQFMPLDDALKLLAQMRAAVAAAAGQARVRYATTSKGV